MITELLEGGELFTQINNNQLTGNYFKEADAVKIIYDLLQTVEYCIRRQIIMCDLKPENILFTDK